jgi:hypothetical protein
METCKEKEQEHIKIKYYKIVLFIVAFLLILKINYFGSKKTKLKLVFHIGKNCIHIHHWFSFLILLFFMNFIRNCKYIYFESMFIIIIAFIFEGLLFDNFYQFFYKNCIYI